MALSNEELGIAVQRLKNLERMAGETVSPFQKANLAQQAVGEVVAILSTLVEREVRRGK